MSPVYLYSVLSVYTVIERVQVLAKEKSKIIQKPAEMIL